MSGENKETESETESGSFWRTLLGILILTGIAGVIAVVAILPTPLAADILFCFATALVFIFIVAVIVKVITPAMLGPPGSRDPLAWAKLAERTGLTRDRTFLRGERVVGTYRGRSLRLDITSKRSTAERSTMSEVIYLIFYLVLFLVTIFGGAGGGDGGSTYIRIVLSVNNQANGFLQLIKRKRVFRSLSRRGVQVGDEQFERRFHIKSQPESFAASVFASADLRQRLLLDTEDSAYLIEVKGQELLWRKKLGMLGHKYSRDVDRLHALFDILSDIAEAVEKTPI